MQLLIKTIEGTGVWAPWIFVGIFLVASLLTIWRLESMSAGGLEGTVIGTLITPYMTGMGNLIFAYTLNAKGGSATEVMKSCLVNNVTNMTLILGVPAIFWSMNLLKKGGAKKSAKSAKANKPDKGAQAREVNRLSLLLTLVAVLFFTGMTWFLGGDGKIDFTDGIVLVGIFLFWQCFHVFEVLKSNARQNKRFNVMLPVDLCLFGLGAYAVYVSTDWLVGWVSQKNSGIISMNYIGLLAGWLNVLPNAMLAMYYAWTRRPEIVYTSQVGDNHICIPLCIGVFAVFIKPIVVPSFFSLGVILLLAATLIHFFFIAAFGRLPRYAGVALAIAYGFFICKVLRGGMLN